MVIGPKNPRNGSRVWQIGRAILLPSHMTVYIDDCTLWLAAGAICNIFRSRTAFIQPLELIDEQENIHIIGRGDAVLSGGVHNELTERTAGIENYPDIVHNILIFFRNIRDFFVRNLQISDPCWWSITFVFCRLPKTRRKIL